MIFKFEFPMETIYPIQQGRVERPGGEYPREKVAEYLSRRVHRLDEEVRPWCEYIAMQCPSFVWEGDQGFEQEEWGDVEKFAMEWQGYTQEEARVAAAPEFVFDEYPYCGVATTCPEGEEICTIGHRTYFVAKDQHPFSLPFAERYLQDLKEYSHVIHPRQLSNYDSVVDQGWMLREGRLEEADELLASLKLAKGQSLYIPGDGIGLFSLIARRRGIPYMSTEPGKCGYLARCMELITSKAVYDPQTPGVLVASQLATYDNRVIYHKGPRIILDQQRWYENHPSDLRIIASTGHRLAVSGPILDGYQPKRLRREGWTGPELQYIMRKLEEKGEILVTNDKLYLSKCALSGLTVYSEAYAGRGPKEWFKAPPVGVPALYLGRGKKEVDPTTRADTNVLGALPFQLRGPAPVFFGRQGERVYSPIHENSQKFGPLMVWHQEGRFFKMAGAYRERLKYRASVWVVNGREELAVRSRLVPEPVVAVQYGRAMRSAQLLLDRREFRGGYWYTPVIMGAVVARVADVDVPRSIPNVVVSKKMAMEQWPSEAMYPRVIELERPSAMRKIDLRGAMGCLET